MQNKKQKPTESGELELKMPSNRPNKIIERRVASRSEDLLYRIVVGCNIIAWLLLVISLVVFHYARPEFITGVQEFWGIDGRDFWSVPHLRQLLSLLQLCLILSLVTIFLRTKRNRRKNDLFGTNLLVLIALSMLSLFILYIML